MAAAAGQTERAIDLIEDVLAGETDQAMIYYRQAELAFIRQDRKALQAARDALADIPPPDGFEDGVARFKAKYPDAEPPIWPINLDVVNRLLECFDKPYRVAYNGCS